MRGNCFHNNPLRIYEISSEACTLLRFPYLGKSCKGTKIYQFILENRFLKT